MKYGPSLLRDRIEVSLPRHGGPAQAMIGPIVALGVLFALSLGFPEYRRQQAHHALRAFTSQLDAETAWMQRAGERSTRRPYVDQFSTQRVPGRSLASCKAQAGLDAQSLERCRSGYEVTRIVRQYR